MDILKRSLGVADYMMFALTLGISASIGIYFRFSGGKQKTTEDYLMAGKDMSILPVAFSLMASYKSAIAILAYPADIYFYGTLVVWTQLGYTIGGILAGILFMQPYFDLHCSTAYEYLEERFGRTMRRFGSLVFVTQTLLYMSVVLYAPALALTAVTNLSLWTSVISIGVVCTMYCTLGGMKAVLWTDVFQAIVMYIGLFALIIIGVMKVGGIKDVFEISYNGGRLLSPVFTEDFTSRYTFWNLMAQSTCLSFSTFGCGQIQVQRLLTIKDIKRSRRALYISLPMSVIFMLLLTFVGLIVFATFHRCDPFNALGVGIKKPDQLLPFFAMISLDGYPGLPGLCISSVFSAALSTVSSAVNSLTAVTLEDFIKPCFGKKPLYRKHSLLIAKIITFTFGAICIVGTFVISRFGSLIQATYTIFGMFGGPILGVFTLGMFTTTANEMGTLVGIVTSTALVAWMSFGSASVGIKHAHLPLSTEGCDSNMTSTAMTTLMSTVTSTPTVVQNVTDQLPPSSTRDIFLLYRVSYMWIIFIGLVCSFLIGYICSLVITLLTGVKKEVRSECLTPLMRNILKPPLKELPYDVTYQKKPSCCAEICENNESTRGVQNAAFHPDAEGKQSTRF